MDFIRSPDAHSTSDDTTDNADHGHLSSSDDDRRWHANQQESLLLDSEDDLSLGTDAHVFMSGVQENTFKNSSQATGCEHLTDEVTRATSKNGENGSELACKHKLAHVGRTESIISDISDLSRTSHDVSSLLNAMTADPEDILTNLGFAEPDLRMRIPERFLQSPSKARGIDVEWFRSSLDQDDSYGSSSQLSPSWSDPGFSRLPLRFITTDTQSKDMVLNAGYSSVPLISEPDEVPDDDSFDLMRHLRLNKPQHATKGMFLEPLVEELEVSSVGSGTVRTKLSRKLSNEEGTIVREESLDKGIQATDVLLDVPHGTNELDMHVGLSEHGNVQSYKPSECGIIVDIEREKTSEKASATDRRLENVELSSVSLSPDAVHRNLTYEEHNKHESELSDYNRNYLPQELSCETQQEFPSFPWAASAANHLKAASIEIQDSFDLEEVGTEDSNDREGLSVADQETSASVKSSEKRLTRENSGESSGFEEMPPDKETTSASSPALNTKRLSDGAQIVQNERRPLMALLDPDVMCAKLDVSPRATFAQRRTKSLTRQRSVYEDAPCEASVRFPETGFPAGHEGTLEVISSIAATTAVSGFRDQSPSSAILSTEDKGVNLSVGTIDCEASTSQESCECEKNYVTAEQSSIESNRHAQHSSERPACVNFEEEALSFSHQCGNVKTIDNSALDPSEHCNLYSDISGKVGDDTAKTRKLSGSVIPDQIEGDDVETQTKCTDPFQLSLEGRETKSELNTESRCIDQSLRHQDIFAPQGQSETILLPDHVGLADACASSSEEQERQTALQKVESEYHQHSLHEINVLEESIQKYETKLSFAEPLDSVRATDCSKKVLVRLTEEVSAIREIRSLISKELERLKRLLDERRIMLLSGATKHPLSPGVSLRMMDLLREQSSLRAGLSNISDELSIRRKACRRARLHAYMDSTKRQLKEERERCTREFREGIKDAVVHELSQKFSSEIEVLRQEVRSKDAVIDQLRMKIAQDERS